MVLTFHVSLHHLLTGLVEQLLLGNAGVQVIAGDAVCQPAKHGR